MAVDIQTYRFRIGSFHMKGDCRSTFSSKKTSTFGCRIRLFRMPRDRGNNGDSYTQRELAESSNVTNKDAKQIVLTYIFLFCVTLLVPNDTSKLIYAKGMESLKTHQLFWDDTGHRVFDLSTNLREAGFANMLPRRVKQIHLKISGIEPNPGPTSSCPEDTIVRRYNAKQEKFRTLEARLDTFTNSHSRFQSPTWEQIAEAGFYYTGYEDECNCFACGCGLSAWEPDDDPWIEHCRHFDECPYVLEVKGGAFVNRYKRRPDPTAAETAINHPAYYRTVGGLALNQDTNPQRVFNRVPENHDLNVDLVRRDTTVRGFNANQERFRTLQARLYTFRNWHSRFQRPTREQIAEAGLYYTGSGDQCCCFACNVVFKNWRGEVDPWIEHCRHSPACPYVRAVKGDEFINCIQHIINQTAVERAPHQHDTRNDTASLIGDNAQNNLDRPNIVYPMFIQQERILYENRMLKQRLMCHICKRNKVETLLLPCGHHRFCMECIHSCDTCPYCSRPITERIRTYMTGRIY